ncbi:MAG TPA: DUF2914 domain-containing protein [Vicinamibacterales bacterium]|nr:DUF2914 domain-containing protein [Vicinamibacterales bacterium]
MSGTGKSSAWTHVAFFTAGFVFDAVMVRRIDDVRVLVQQGLYLLLSGVLLATLIAWRHRPPQLRAALAWVPRWIEPTLHFMLGTLLNAYALFYIRSASGLIALLFFVVIALLLLVNELPSIRRLGPVVLYGLYSFSLTSYFAYLYPVLVGRIRWWMFPLAVATSAVPLVLVGRVHRRRADSGRQVVREALVPSLGVQAVLLALYVFHLIPPVPLSLMEIGIYNDVTRTPEGAYRVTYETPPWYRFWSKDDVVFVARAGDRVFTFFRVFAPRGFRDEIRVAWLSDQPGHGWTRAGDVPIAVTGGREGGYAGYSYKQNWRAGEWRVIVTTADGREIGRRTFVIRVDDDPSRPRAMTVDTR